MARSDGLTNLTNSEIRRRLGELGSLREDSVAETQDDKIANTDEQSAPPEPLPFGQNLLGITFLADDWEDDLPLELFEGDDSFLKP